MPSTSWRYRSVVLLSDIAITLFNADACWSAVARIGLVKPEKARGVENLILQMAQRGQVTEKVQSCSSWC